MSTLFQQAMAAYLPFEEIQSRGMPASRSYFDSLYDEFTAEMLALTDELSLYYDDKPINPGSPKDSLDFILSLGLQPTKRTDTGAWSTAKDSIEHLRYLDGDAGAAMSLFFNWREIQHRRDSFCVPVLDSMNRNNLCTGSTDIHNIMGDLQITRTASRRPSMKKQQGKGINLLNLPSRQGVGMADGLNKRIRAGFIAPPGETLLANDESQIELRLLAHFSNDPTLVDIYINGGDIHATTAEAMFNVPPDQQDNSLHRKPAKNLNFATGYGGGAHKLWTMYRQANITQYSEQDCQKFIDAFYSKYNKVPEWKDEVIWYARRDGYVSTYSGMRRYLPNLWSKDNGIRAKAEREAVNHIIQGSAQDLIQNSMAWVYKQLLDYRDAGVNVWLALQLYDELIHRVDTDAVDLIDSVVVEGLEQHHGMRDCRVPILADSSQGNCWAEI